MVVVGWRRPSAAKTISFGGVVGVVEQPGQGAAITRINGVSRGWAERQLGEGKARTRSNCCGGGEASEQHRWRWDPERTDELRRGAGRRQHREGKT